jgi:hypothetical protein
VSEEKEEVIEIISEDDLPEEAKEEFKKFKDSLGKSMKDLIMYTRLQSDIRDRIADILDNQDECAYISKVVKTLVKKSADELGDDIKKMKDTNDKISYESYVESLIHMLKIYSAVYKVAYSLKIHMIKEYKVKQQIIEHVDLDAQFDTEKSAEYNTQKFDNVLKDTGIQININTDYLQNKPKEKERKDSYIA